MFYQAILLVPFFQKHFLISCLYHTGNSHNTLENFIIIMFVTVICDEWSLMLLL